MRLKNYSLPLIVILILSISVISCKDEWDNHYYATAANKSDLNLYQFIQSRQDLSKFAEMLKMTGYDTILTKSQTFTVWAPNNASLAAINLNDTALVLKLVTNHITRYSYSTTVINTKVDTLLMFDNKLLRFAKESGGYSFDGKPILEADLATVNGIVHVLGEYSPYKMNFWEFISQTPGLDSLRNYINSITRKEFDPAKSFQDGVLVDSIFKKTNVVFDNVAAMDTEDSIYTAILPDNVAWTEAYNRIAPYFRALPIDGGAAAQMANTKLNLVKDLFFRGKLTSPLSADTIRSTIGHKFATPNRLFNAAQFTELSNGYSYVTSKLNIEAKESWLGENRLEAEFVNFKEADLVNYTKNIISSIGSGLGVSSGYYLKAESKTNSSISKLYLNFWIPNTLAAKYNIYCVFVPASLGTPGDGRPNKVKFYLSYVDATGKQITNAAIDATNNVTTPTKAAATFTTKPFLLDKMLVAKDVVFPYSNLYYDSKSITTVALKVENAAGVLATDLANFNRNLLIDCIILEPVQ